MAPESLIYKVDLRSKRGASLDPDGGAAAAVPGSVSYLRVLLILLQDNPEGR